MPRTRRGRQDLARAGRDPKSGRGPHAPSGAHAQGPGRQGPSGDKLENRKPGVVDREALKGSDIEPVRTGMTALAETLQRVSTAAYQASAAESGPTDGAGDGSSNGAGGDGDPDGRATARPRSRRGSRRRRVQGGLGPGPPRHRTCDTPDPTARVFHRCPQQAGHPCSAARAVLRRPVDLAGGARARFRSGVHDAGVCPVPFDSGRLCARTSGVAGLLPSGRACSSIPDSPRTGNAVTSAA